MPLDGCTGPAGGSEVRGVKVGLGLTDACRREVLVPQRRVGVVLVVVVVERRRGCEGDFPHVEDETAAEDNEARSSEPGGERGSPSVTMGKMGGLGLTEGIVASCRPVTTPGTIVREYFTESNAKRDELMLKLTGSAARNTPLNMIMSEMLFKNAITAKWPAHQNRVSHKTQRVEDKNSHEEPPHRVLHEQSDDTLMIQLSALLPLELDRPPNEEPEHPELEQQTLNHKKVQHNPNQPSATHRRKATCRYPSLTRNHTNNAIHRQNGITPREELRRRDVDDLGQGQAEEGDGGQDARDEESGGDDDEL